jgi:hypothetical protein
MLMRCTLTLFVFFGIGLNGANGQDPPWNGRTDGAKGADGTREESVWVHADERVDEREHDISGKAIVTVNQLRMPGKVMKELGRSDQAMGVGDVRGSAEHLEKASKLNPTVAQVHNVLGARYAALKEYDKAVGEFEKAVALNPQYRLAVDNISAVLCMQHRYAEAEQVARRALLMEPEAASSRYLLGSILIEEGGYSLQEGIALLEIVKEEYPRARLFLAKAKSEMGETEEARGELGEYLRSPRTRDKTLAKEWLGKVEEQERKTKQEEVERKMAEAARRFTEEECEGEKRADESVWERETGCQRPKPD